MAATRSRATHALEDGIGDGERVREDDEANLVAAHKDGIERVPAALYVGQAPSEPESGPVRLTETHRSLCYLDIQEIDAARAAATKRVRQRERRTRRERVQWDDTATTIAVKII